MDHKPPSKTRIRALAVSGIALAIIALACLATPVVFAANPGGVSARPLRSFTVDLKLNYALRQGQALKCKVVRVRKQGKKYLTRVQCVETAAPVPTPTPTPVPTSLPYPYPYP